MDTASLVVYIFWSNPRSIANIYKIYFLYVLYSFPKTPQKSLRFITCSNKGQAQLKLKWKRNLLSLWSIGNKTGEKKKECCHTHTIHRGKMPGICKERVTNEWRRQAPFIFFDKYIRKARTGELSSLAELQGRSAQATGWSLPASESGSNPNKKNASYKVTWSST